MLERPKQFGAVFVLLTGGVGGGLLIARILKHFSVFSPLIDLICLVYWCSFCLLTSKIELKSDIKSNYNRGYSDGYSAGHEEGLMMGISAKSKGSYDKGYEGYDSGYEAGHEAGIKSGIEIVLEDPEAYFK